MADSNSNFPSPRAGSNPPTDASTTTPTTTTSTSTARPSLSPPRQRPLERSSTSLLADVIASSSRDPRRPSSRPRRRDSFMTNDTAFSIKSSTDDLLLPRPRREGVLEGPGEHESSHLHSLPLVLAVLPAIAGTLVSGGNILLTDVTLLVLASVFLNWSVRLPWDWYHLAQQVLLASERGGGGRDEEGEGAEGYFPSTTTVIEEQPLPIHPEESKSPKSESRPRTPMNRSKSPARSDDDEDGDGEAAATTTPRPRPTAAQSSAATELRLHELVALLACFVSPLLGAYVLHAVRGQLSRPSEGLVSDYNLSIFILAAELRPLSHLLKMVQTRTLHLQRIVAKNPHLHPTPTATADSSSPSSSLIKDLQTRLDELESHIARTSAAGALAGGAATATTDPKLEEKQTQIAAKKALQPDLDAITRAIRRYEKRATLLGLQTEARLNELEARLRDALTLAAGAERAASRRGVLGHALDGAVWIVGLPARAAAGATGFALGLAGEVLGVVKGRLPSGAGLIGRGSASGSRVEKSNGWKEGRNGGVGSGGGRKDQGFVGTKGKERERRRRE